MSHIAFTNPKGAKDSLKGFKDDFHENYLKEIEKKVMVYRADKGLVDLGKEIDPEYFKRLADEVFIKFKPSNPDKFEIDEAVQLKLLVKNVPELKVKVFEFNTETYYKKNLKPFDTSINLHGMVPSIEKVLKEQFAGLSKNKISEINLELPELQGKVGLFIIELFGNGIMSRAVIKKGSLTLIHRSTERGHAAYILDD